MLPTVTRGMVAKLLTGEAGSGLGAWDLIVVVDIFHILKSQE